MSDRDKDEGQKQLNRLKQRFFALSFLFGRGQLYRDKSGISLGFSRFPANAS